MMIVSKNCAVERELRVEVRERQASFDCSCVSKRYDDDGDDDILRIWAQICSVIARIFNRHWATKPNEGTHSTYTQIETKNIYNTHNKNNQIPVAAINRKKNAHAILSHQFCDVVFLSAMIFGWRCASDWPLRIACSSFCFLLLLSDLSLVFSYFDIVILDVLLCRWPMLILILFFFCFAHSFSRRVLFWSCTSVAYAMAGRNYCTNIESIPNC